MRERQRQRTRILIEQRSERAGKMAGKRERGGAREREGGREREMRGGREREGGRERKRERDCKLIYEKSSVLRTLAINVEQQK